MNRRFKLILLTMFVGILCSWGELRGENLVCAVPVRSSSQAEAGLSRMTVVQGFDQKRLLAEGQIGQLFSALVEQPAAIIASILGSGSGGVPEKIAPKTRLEATVRHMVAGYRSVARQFFLPYERRAFWRDKVWVGLIVPFDL